MIDESMDKLVQDMNAEVQSGPAIYRPSRFWEKLGIVNAAQLRDPGFQSFKRTINQNYFNWVIDRPWDPQYRSLIAEWLRHPALGVTAARIIDGARIEVTTARRQALPSSAMRLSHAIFVAMLWDHARREDQMRLLDRLSEPSLGDPILVSHRGRAISQDLANSVMDLYSIGGAFRGSVPANATVVELGPGYGRLGWLLLSVVPGVRYIAVDIPPALAVAQEYLTRLFPDLVTAHFQRGLNHLGPELSGARLAFLTPNQLDGIASLEADLFINISSLQEMRPEQISHYLNVVDRHTRGVFYMKQLRSWTNPQDGVTVSEGDYAVPTSWRTVFHRRHPIQTQFFEAAFQIGG